MRFIYSIHVIQVFSFVCVLTWSLLGVKKAWATPRSVSFRGLIQNFRRASPPLSYAESPSRVINLAPSLLASIGCAVKLRFKDTRLVRTPHCYGQFSLSLVKVSPHSFFKFNPIDTDTPIIRTLCMAPSDSVLTGFDCIECCTAASPHRRVQGSNPSKPFCFQAFLSQLKLRI